MLKPPGLSDLSEMKWLSLRVRNHLRSKQGATLYIFNVSPCYSLPHKSRTYR